MFIPAMPSIKFTNDLSEPGESNIGQPGRRDKKGKCGQGAGGRGSLSGGFRTEKTPKG